MKRRIAVVVVWALCFVGAALAQTPASTSKKGSEHEKLALFVGKWSAEADFKPSETSSDGKAKWTETCKWFEGNFALTCDSEGEFGGRHLSI
jgi:hypothetical protein